MKIKKGDKLYCKKSIHGDNNEFIFIKGEYYNVKFVQEVENPIIMMDDKLDKIVYFTYYRIKNTQNAYSWEYNRYIWDYFCTQKGMRKEKLKKICLKN